MMLPGWRTGSTGSGADCDHVILPTASTTSWQRRWAVYFSQTTIYEVGHHVKPPPQSGGLTRWRCHSVCPFVCLFVRPSPTRTDRAPAWLTQRPRVAAALLGQAGQWRRGLSHRPFGPHRFVNIICMSSTKYKQPSLWAVLGRGRAGRGRGQGNRPSNVGQAPNFETFWWWRIVASYRVLGLSNYCMGPHGTILDTQQWAVLYGN